MKYYSRCVSFAQSCLTLCDPWTAACQAPLSMGFFRQEFKSGLSFPPPGDLPDSGIELNHLCLLHYRWILYHWGIGKSDRGILVLYFYKFSVCLKTDMSLKQKNQNTSEKPQLQLLAPWKSEKLQQLDFMQQDHKLPIHINSSREIFFFLDRNTLSLSLGILGLVAT